MLKAHVISGRYLSDPLPELDDLALDRILFETAHRGNHLPCHTALREALLSTLLNYRRFQALDSAPSLSAARASLRATHRASIDLLANIRAIEECGTLLALVARQVGREHPSGQPPAYDILRAAIAAARDLERWFERAVAGTAFGVKRPLAFPRTGCLRALCLGYSRNCSTVASRR